MPINWTTNWNGNQRVVAIPVTPTAHLQFEGTAAGTFALGAPLVLGNNNTTAGFVNAYVYYVYGNPHATVAAASLIAIIQFQFQNAAHAAVGGAINFLLGSTASGPGNGVISPMPPFAPAWPGHMLLPVPATAVELAPVVFLFGVVGAPVVDFTMGWGIDTGNATGTPGDIGGGGAVAQSTNSPNTF